jgi:hypothetical protein
MTDNILFNNVDSIKNFLSYVEGDDIKNTISKIPLYSFIVITDNTGTHSGVLIELKKTFFKIIQNIDDLNSIIKVKFSNVYNIYYISNMRTYKRDYQNANKDKKKESNRRYYLNKKNKLEQLKQQSE